jgi:hypothetical protein
MFISAEEVTPKLETHIHVLWFVHHGNINWVMIIRLISPYVPPFRLSPPDESIILQCLRAQQPGTCCFMTFLAIIWIVMICLHESPLSVPPPMLPLHDLPQNDFREITSWVERWRKNFSFKHWIVSCSLNKKMATDRRWNTKSEPKLE